MSIYKAGRPWKFDPTTGAGDEIGTEPYSATSGGGLGVAASTTAPRTSSAWWMRSRVKYP